MKRFARLFISALLVLSLIISFTGCGNKQETEEAEVIEEVQEEELDYENMTAEDLIADFEGKDSLTVEEYIWLLSTYKYVPITEDLERVTGKESITDEAFDLLEEKEVGLPIADVPATFIEDESPQLRGLAYEYMTSFTGLSKDHQNLAATHLANEQDDYVIARALQSLANEGVDNPEIGKFLLEQADHENPKIREIAGRCIGSSWNENLDGALEAMVKLCGDSEELVRRSALKHIGSLNDDSIVPLLEEVLKDPAQHSLHSAAMDSINDLWLDFPFHVNHSEAAYKVMMDYIKATPRTEDVPDSSAIFFLGSRTDDEDFEEWKAASPHYNETEMLDALVEIVKDKDADWMARTASLQVIKDISPERLRSLQSMIDGLSDEDADFVKSSYKDKIESLDKE